MIGFGIGSSKMYEFSWGYSHSPMNILNMYLALSGYQATAHQIVEERKSESTIFLESI